MAKRRITLKPFPITIALQSIKCLEETDEVGSDEPYVLVTGIDLKKTIPQVEVTRYGPWGDVDQGETKYTKAYPKSFSQETIKNLSKIAILRVPFWGLDNKTAKMITSDDDVIFIVSVMENDDGDPEAARGLVKAATIATLAGSVGMSRNERVNKVIADTKAALGIPTGAPNFDDHIGTKELRLTAKDRWRPFTGPYLKKLFFTGDGGHYKTTFEFRKG